MVVRNFTPFPVLYTDRLELRALDREDSSEIFFLRSDQTILQFLNKAPAASVEEVNSFIENIIKSVGKNETIYWVISLKGDKKAIGTICFWRFEIENYRAEIGYVLSPEYFRKGLMSEALRAVMKYGFDTMKLHTVTANVNPMNIASIRLLTSNGFIKEGYFRESYYFEGKFFDSEIYTCINQSPH